MLEDKRSRTNGPPGIATEKSKTLASSPFFGLTDTTDYTAVNVGNRVGLALGRSKLAEKS